MLLTFTYSKYPVVMYSDYNFFDMGHCTFCISSKLLLQKKTALHLYMYNN